MNRSRSGLPAVLVLVLGFLAGSPALAVFDMGDQLVAPWESSSPPPAEVRLGLTDAVGPPCVWTDPVGASEPPAAKSRVRADSASDPFEPLENQGFRCRSVVGSLKARFYDPEIGVFLSMDPAEGSAATPPSLHRYLYAYQNPTVYVDPDGRRVYTPQQVLATSDALLEIELDLETLSAEHQRLADSLVGSRPRIGNEGLTLGNHLASSAGKVRAAKRKLALLEAQLREGLEFLGRARIVVESNEGPVAQKEALVAFLETEVHSHTRAVELSGAFLDPLPCSGFTCEVMREAGENGPFVRAMQSMRSSQPSLSGASFCSLPGLAWHSVTATSSHSWVASPVLRPPVVGLWSGQSSWKRPGGGGLPFKRSSGTPPPRIRRDADDAAKASSDALRNLEGVPWGAYCRTGCEDVAKKIEATIGGKVHRIEPGLPGARFLGPRGGVWTEWQYHEVVVKGDRVYDALTGPDGLAIEQYKKLWEYADDITFGF